MCTIRMPREATPEMIEAAVRAEQNLVATGCRPTLGQLAAAGYRAMVEEVERAAKSERDKGE